MAVTFRRIRADEVQPGMRVARARSHSFRLVTATEQLPTTTRILFDVGELLRPQHDVRLWLREDDPEPEAPLHSKTLRGGAVAAVYASRSDVFIDGENIGNVGLTDDGWRVLLYAHVYPGHHEDVAAAKVAALALLR
jgi:hypothetical protein